MSKTYRMTLRALRPTLSDKDWVNDLNEKILQGTPYKDQNTRQLKRNLTRNILWRTICTDNPRVPRKVRRDLLRQTTASEQPTISQRGG